MPIDEKLIEQKPEYGSKYQTTDYERNDTAFLKAYDRSLAHKDHFHIRFIIRTVLVLITAVLISILVILARSFKTVFVCSLLKPALIRLLMTHFPHELGLAYGGWTALFVVCMGLAAAVCVYIEPQAGGNDISDLTAFFNGVLIKNLFTLKTGLVTFTSMLAQIPVGIFGTEVGPILKIGAAVGYSLPKIFFPVKMMVFLRDEKEKRNLALCGMAAGFAAALNAPLAGTFIALEHTTNNFNATLFQYVSLCAWMAKFLTQYAMMDIFSNLLPKDSMDNQPFLMYGRINNNHVEYWGYEVLLYILVGVIGGIFGYLWKKSTLLITRLRTFLSNGAKSFLFVEAVLWAAFAGWFHITLLYVFRYIPCIHLEHLDMEEVKPNVTSPTDLFVMPGITCTSEEYMPQAGILLISPHHIIIFMVHAHPHTFSLLLLALVLLFLYLQTSVVVGMCVSTGVFVSHVIIGTLWGRLMGEWLYSHIGEEWCHPSKFAMLGAAAQLGGIFHYRLVGVSMLIETTGSYQTYVVPLLITSGVAHCASYFINKSNYYEMILRFLRVPFISSKIPFTNIHPVTSIMTQAVIHLPLTPTVRNIMEVLSLNKGRYPVYNDTGIILGDISRYYLCAILLEKMQDYPQPINPSNFRTIIPKLCNFSSSIEYYDKSMKKLRLILTATDLEKEIQLMNFVNCSFHEIPMLTNVAGVWTYMRQTGVHTLYVTQKGKVVGIVTRKDLLTHQKTTGQ